MAARLPQGNTFRASSGSAIRQRTRWITGIGLQSWEFHSFGETLRHFYWFWRDRKSLVGNMVGPLSNLLFLYGVITLAWALSTHQEWRLGQDPAWMGPIAAIGLAFQLLHTSIRIVCCARIYGWRFAAGVPLRVAGGNWINCFATCKAIYNYSVAKWHGTPLRWVKTEHAYPSRTTLLGDRNKLVEILTGRAWIYAEQLSAALSSLSPPSRIGEHLIAMVFMTEDDLYVALAVQNRLPVGMPEPASVSVAVTRSLPAAVARKWRVLPFRIAAGELYVASTELPGDAMQEEIRRFSSLEIRFHLVTPSAWNELARKSIYPKGY